jgi:hypothetical protein
VAYIRSLPLCNLRISTSRLRHSGVTVLMQRHSKYLEIQLSHMLFNDAVYSVVLIYRRMIYHEWWLRIWNGATENSTSSTQIRPVASECPSWLWSSELFTVMVCIGIHIFTSMQVFNAVSYNLPIFLKLIIHVIYFVFLSCQGGIPFNWHQKSHFKVPSPY